MLYGRTAALLAEQGLGDILFFLRFAAPLREGGATLVFAGEPRLHPLIGRTGLVDRLEDAFDFEPGVTPVLLGDLPSIGDFRVRPTLRVTPDAQRLERLRDMLERLGPRPWTGVTWRAGTPADVVAHGLYKTVPAERLAELLRPLGGTVFALQRGMREGELAAASAALGRPVHDLAAFNEDPEDALALMALLDRYIGVSNTNMHLAVACGAVADVMVPFPPEWRWSLAGDSPWFPGFRVHRQLADGDWGGAFASLAASLQGASPRP